MESEKEKYENKKFNVQIQGDKSASGMTYSKIWAKPQVDSEERNSNFRHREQVPYNFISSIRELICFSSWFKNGIHVDANKIN